MAYISMKLIFLSTLMSTRIHPLGAAVWKCVTGNHCFLEVKEERTNWKSARSRCVEMGGVLATEEGAFRLESDFADSPPGPCNWVNFVMPKKDQHFGKNFWSGLNLLYTILSRTIECTMMCDTKDGGKTIKDALCVNKLPYICQRASTPVPKKPAGTQPASTPVPKKPAGTQPASTPVPKKPAGTQPASTPVPKKPAGTQPGVPTDPPLSTKPPRKKPDRKRPKRHVPSKKVFAITTSGLIAGTPLIIRMLSMPTMCARLCEATGGCKMFNYHKGTGECRAFPFKTRAREPGDGQWGAWELASV